MKTQELIEHEKNYQVDIGPVIGLVIIIASAMVSIRIIYDIARKFFWYFKLKKRDLSGSLFGVKGDVHYLGPRI